MVKKQCHVISRLGNKGNGIGIKVPKQLGYLSLEYQVSNLPIGLEGCFIIRRGVVTSTGGVFLTVPYIKCEKDKGKRENVMEIYYARLDVRERDTCMPNWQTTLHVSQNSNDGVI